MILIVFHISFWTIWHSLLNILFTNFFLNLFLSDIWIFKRFLWKAIATFSLLNTFLCSFQLPFLCVCVLCETIICAFVCGGNSPWIWCGAVGQLCSFLSPFCVLLHLLFACMYLCVWGNPPLWMWCGAVGQLCASSRREADSAPLQYNTTLLFYTALPWHCTALLYLPSLGNTELYPSITLPCPCWKDLPSPGNREISFQKFALLC